MVRRLKCPTRGSTLLQLLLRLLQAVPKATRTCAQQAIQPCNIHNLPPLLLLQGATRHPIWRLSFGAPCLLVCLLAAGPRRCPPATSALAQTVLSNFLKQYSAPAQGVPSACSSSTQPLHSVHYQLCYWDTPPNSVAQQHKLLLLLLWCGYATGGTCPGRQDQGRRTPDPWSPWCHMQRHQVCWPPHTYAHHYHSEGPPPAVAVPAALAFCLGCSPQGLPP
jgi:hypothetical protein